MVIHVTADQKRKLQKRARLNRTSVATEILHAIDTHLAGVSDEGFALIDAATRQAERDIRAMIDRLERTNRRIDAIFTERERLHATARTVSR
jgi:hypothetical protein